MGFHGGWVLWGEVRAKIDECLRLCLVNAEFTSEDPRSDFTKKLNNPFI